MSWRETTIDAVTEVVTKGTTPTTYGMPFTDEGVNFVKAEALNGDCALDRAGFTFISPETHEKLKRSQLQAGDVLMTIAGANVGKCGLVRETDLPANTNQAVALMRVNCEVADPRFVYYHFKQPWMLGYCRSLGGQAAQPNVNLASLKRFTIRLPDLPTQQRIAGILSAYDDLIENNRRRIGLLEQAARLLYREWFVHLRFPGHETAKIVDGLPEGWTRCVVEDLLVLQRGFDLPVGDRKEGDVPVYGSTGIVGFHNEPKVPAPTIITGRSGSLGQVAISDTPCWPLNTALWVKELKNIPATLGYYLLLGLELEKYNGGASVPTLDRKVVHRLPAVRPSSAVADQFDSIASKSFQTIAKLRTYNAQLTRARDLLLPRLMDGRIPV
jgi:type I restriction enzyme, S subunit